MAAFIPLNPLITSTSSFIPHSSRTTLKSPAKPADPLTPQMIAKPENEPNAAISRTVQTLYDTYPFPPETLLDSPPLGYNWRWHTPSAHAFCHRRTPSSAPRILDAGCGTGESTSYLLHLNPDAHVTAMDLSAGALSVARERIERAIPDAINRLELVHKSIFDAEELQGTFDHINCVGVIHHTPDPDRALRALANKLKPGGILHIFVYGKHGRWEISLMQRALRLLRGSDSFEDGVALGRRVFASLPDGNRLKEREKTRWAHENVRDANFADMYLHPHEVDYDIDTLLALIRDSGLQFAGFSNPRTWDLSRLFNDPDLLAHAQSLKPEDQWRLVELLDPDSTTHFEFFLVKPPYTPFEWTDHALRTAIAHISPCITGFPSTTIMDRDYYPITLSDQEHALMTALSSSPDLGAALSSTNTSPSTALSLADAGLILLTPQ